MKSAFILFVGFLGVHFQNAFAFFGANTYRTFSFSRPTDLSFAIDENTVHWDSSQKVSTTRNEIYLPDSTYKSFNKVCFPEHGGTHLDAPSYITKNGRRVADIPIDSLIESGKEPRFFLFK
uniref:Uncharacterized protein n=1 Tax=Cacopsylla melanoneura TaxID=428564 RepID=A0A8D9AC29_9HEMI